MISHSLVSQLLLCHHNLHDVPKVFTLHLLPIFGDVTDADAGNLPHMLGCELESVCGTTASGGEKKSNNLLAEFMQALIPNSEWLN